VRELRPEVPLNKEIAALTSGIGAELDFLYIFLALLLTGVPGLGEELGELGAESDR